MRGPGAEHFVDEHLDGAADGRRVHAVQLHGEGVPLLGRRLDHLQGLDAALDQRRVVIISQT